MTGSTMMSKMEFLSTAALMMGCNSDLYVGSQGVGGTGWTAGVAGVAGVAEAAGEDQTDSDDDHGPELTIESLAYRAELYGGHGDGWSDPWVVNSSVHGLSGGTLFVGGYVTGGNADGGFIDRVVNDALEPVAEPRWISGIWAASTALQYAVGNSSVFRLTDAGSELAYQASGSAPLIDVWGLAADDVVVVGFEGRILHYDGQSWANQASGVTSDLRAVWGSDPEHLYAVGKGGVVLQGRSGSWTSMDSGTPIDLNGIWGRAPDDVYAVGGSELDPGHVILHYDGEAWAVVDRGNERLSTLLGVSGAGNAVYAVGAYRDAEQNAHALLYRYDGTAWKELPVDYPQFFWDIWCAEETTCYVVGPDDTLLKVTAPLSLG